MADEALSGAQLSRALSLSMQGRNTAMARTVMSLNRRHMLAGTAAAITAVAAPSLVRAQAAPLKVGLLLPRSGFEASFGLDCQRGADLAAPILKSLGMPDLAVTNGDTESNVDVSRERAEKLINEGAQLLIGAFDSGQSTAIAQVCEQKGIPFVINLAAAPDITEQGYKFVFRNFPTAPMILADAFADQKEIFTALGKAPSTAVYMHVNDTFGTAMAKGISVVMPKYQMPYKIIDEISYDPLARDLSVEVAKAKAANPEVLLLTSRLNDSILLTRELVKQRWTPQAILSMGPGWYEDQYLKTLGKYSDGPISFAPWYDPNKRVSKMLDAAMGKSFPGINLSTNQVYTFEALLIAADAYKRAGTTDPKALAQAIAATNITDNVSIGPGIQFNAKGQNDKIIGGGCQNRGGKLLTVAPIAAANAKAEWPLKPYQDRA
jgi:branched-chain amino acid transport system substrate-binding protein